MCKGTRRSRKTAPSPERAQVLDDSFRDLDVEPRVRGDVERAASIDAPPSIFASDADATGARDDIHALLGGGVEMKRAREDEP